RSFSSTCGWGCSPSGSQAQRRSSSRRCSAPRSISSSGSVSRTIRCATRGRAHSAPLRSLVLFGCVEEVDRALAHESYLPDRGLATAIFLGLAMRRPLLLEGEAGVGKTEVGKTLARVVDAELIRLQCYEGIDASQALYEWDYARQLLYARSLQAENADPDRRIRELSGPGFPAEGPLLQAIRAGSGAVLLIDELDRADDEFEAFLLEVLADYAVTIPEIGTISAPGPPR